MTEAYRRLFSYLRPFRGGGWNDEPRNLRSAVRLRNDSDDWNIFIGFRLARTR